VVARIDLSRPQRGMTRTELTLRQLGDAWRSQIRGRRYLEGLVEFLRSRSNENTLRAYSYSVLQFFGWYESHHRRLVTPDLIKRVDAAEYDRWLRTRDVGLRLYYLERDPSRRFDVMLFETLRRAGEQGLSFEALYAAVRQRQPVTEAELAKRLACLVALRTLKRTPSLSQIRRGEVDVGLPPKLAKRVGIDVPVPERVFRYFAPEKNTPADERATTVAARLSALSALWRWYMSAGENLPGGGEPLLRVNIWGELLRKAARQAPEVSRKARREKTTTLTIFERLLSSTYRDTHGTGALQMAASRMRPSVIEAPPKKAGARASYNDIRDRALMLMLGQLGLRAQQISRMQRADLDQSGPEPMLTLRGKGGKVRQVAVPPATMESLAQLENKLREMSRHQRRYGRKEVAASLLSPEAPLIPVVKQWGANAGKSSVAKGIGRSGVAMMLRRRAVQVGIQPGTAEFKRVHPHGLRHLFAKTAHLAGTPLPVLQAILGHSRGSQTLQYVEEHDPSQLMSQAFQPPTEPEPLPPAAPMPDRPLVAGPETFERFQEQILTRPVPATPRPRPDPAPSRLLAPPEPAEATVTQFEVLVDEPELSPKTPTPPAEEPGLVGVGAEPVFQVLDEEEAATEDEREQSYTLDKLQAIYAERWGERGERGKLGSTEPTEEETMAAALQSDMNLQLLGVTAEEVDLDVEDNRLSFCYVGDDSGLIWWAGSTGALKPNMPVMSPEQAGDCDLESQSAICRRLSALWSDWIAGGGRGPTGAAALVAWLAESLETTRQVEGELLRRGAQWVPPLAPWDETADEPRGIERTTFREHEEDAIVAWFETQAWQFRRYPTRGQKVIDEPVDLPDYYGEADPLASLSVDERQEALDWLAALTNQKISRSSAPIVGTTASRGEVVRFVQRMCTYDQTRTDLGEARRSGASDFEKDLLERGMAQTAKEIERIALLYGDERIDYPALVDRRVRGRRSGADEREQLRTFYRRIVRQVFGPGAADDAVIKLVAMCGNVPLSEMQDLFRIDRALGTIAHTRETQRRMAEQTGAHSECVARRMARDLWELQKKHRTGSRQRVFSRPDELVERVQAMAAYRVPCPKALESELRWRLPAARRRQPLPVYEAYAKSAAESAEDRPDVLQALIEEEMEGFTEDFEEQMRAELFAGEGMMVQNPGRPMPFTAAAAAWLPTPVQLVAAVLMGA